ncbi:MAG: DMT family transporter [Pseudomonadota bacterium]
MSGTEVTPAAPQPTPSEKTRLLLGIGMIILAMTIVPIMDGIAKHLTSSMNTMQIVWGRYFFHFALFLPLVLYRHGGATFRLQRPALQILRGAFLLCSTFCFFSAIRTLPLADALAVVFVFPFLVTALAPVLLGDSVGFYRWTAVLVGFAGALVVIQPGFSTISVGTLWALAAGTIYAFYILATRKLAGSDPTLVTLLMTGLVGTVASTLALPWFWSQPTAFELILMALTGLLAAIGHYLIILAHEYATAPQLAPFAYFEILATTVVGFIAFGDFPGFVTWIGIALIVLSGLVIGWREAVRGQQS